VVASVCETIRFGFEAGANAKEEEEEEEEEEDEEEENSARPK
jgi:hypothetical protein